MSEHISMAIARGTIFAALFFVTFVLLVIGVSTDSWYTIDDDYGVSGHGGLWGHSDRKNTKLIVTRVFSILAIIFSIFSVLLRGFGVAQRNHLLGRCAYVTFFFTCESALCMRTYTFFFLYFVL